MAPCCVVIPALIVLAGILSGRLCTRRALSLLKSCYVIGWRIAERRVLALVALIAVTESGGLNAIAQQRVWQTGPSSPAIQSPRPRQAQPAQETDYKGSQLKSQTGEITPENIDAALAVNATPMCCVNSLLPVITSPSPSLDGSESNSASRDLDSCHVHRVGSLPGSHQFGSDFIEAMATDPNPKAKDSNAVWGLTADLSGKMPSRDRAMYISKSIDGGKTWTEVARVSSRYFDAWIGEGERNGLGVSPGGTEFVITTQRGAFQVFPGASAFAPVVKSIAGPRVRRLDPRVSIPKRRGDPVTANVVKITADGKHMIVGYGYFDLHPQIFTYHKDGDGSWINDGPLPHIPTEMDILSMELGDSKNLDPGFLYVGTGDQAYRFSFQTMSWIRIAGVGPDSAIQGISTVGGLHLAACWGIYLPLGPDLVARVTTAEFLLHRGKDQAGSNIRAYSIEVDPANPDREVATSATGVYTSGDSGKSWERLNDLPDQEFRLAHFNTDGTVIVSGIAGTFLANPFSNRCAPHLRTRR